MSIYVEYAAGLSLLRRREFALGISERKVAYALNVLGHADLIKPRAPFGALKGLLCSVYPARIYSYGMCGIHKITHNKTAVLKIRKAAFVS